MKRRRMFHVLLSVLIGVSPFMGCGGGSSSNQQTTDHATEQADTHDADSQSIRISGFAHKGPMQKGGFIEIYELDDAFNQTGISFQTETLNDYGEYFLQASLGSRYIELFARGYFYDEISARISDGWMRLDAIADTYANTEININLLTTLSKKRQLALIANGLPFDQANAQAQDEVLRAFGITDEVGMSFDEMDLFGEQEGDAALLAISSIVQQMATSSANDSVAAALSELISVISNDLADNGQIDTAEIHETITMAIPRIRPRKIKHDLETRFPETSVPSFANIINDLIYDYAYGNHQKYLLSITCVANCAELTNVLLLELLEKETVVIAVDGQGKIMGSFADNEGNVSGTLNADGACTHLYLSTYIDFGKTFDTFYGYGMISFSPTGIVTGSVTSSYHGPEISLNGQILSD